MRRRLESLLPAAVLIGFLAAALVVNLLLDSAQDRGLDALEDSVTSEVRAIAGGQDQRFRNQFANASNLSGLGEEPFHLEEGSPEDLEQLEDVVQLAESAGVELRSGFYLLDVDGTITQGVLFKDDPIGTTFEWPGLDELADSGALEGPAILPLAEGLTTDEPVYGFILPIRETLASGELGPRRIGSFVLEQVVASDSDLNHEIGALQRGDTGKYFFFDNTGGVIASNDSSTIGHVLEDERLLTEPEGLHRIDDQVVVLADVPTPRWRVAFRQDAGEFTQALTGPLESTGRILIFTLLASGLVLTALLYRRLRAARAEQERLRALNEAQQEFISIVSHELRTPVAGVLGFLETSLDHWEVMDDGERKAAITRAAANARRLQAMTRDVLDTQSVEAGRLVHVFDRLDLGGEIRVAVEAVREVEPERRIDVHLPEDPVWIDGDADRLQQVLANLIENASKNSPAVEPVGIELTRVGSMAEVAVSDHGPGIAEESLERIFDKFVRGRGDTVSGTGLGLYISRRIINAHAGRIWAESEPGQGATFRFVVPQSVAAGPGVEPATEAAGTTTAD